MSRTQRRCKKTEPRKFIIFVKPLDEKGLVDERNCGWLCKDMVLDIKPKNAIQFTEKEDGHGSYNDWIKLIGEDRPNWSFPDVPTYVDELKSLSNP